MRHRSLSSRPDVPALLGLSLVVTLGWSAPALAGGGGNGRNAPIETVLPTALDPSTTLKSKRRDVSECHAQLDRLRAKIMSDQQEANEKAVERRQAGSERARGKLGKEIITLRRVAQARQRIERHIARSCRKLDNDLAQLEGRSRASDPNP